METLRISPKYTAENWQKLDEKDKAHWSTAVAIVRDRLHGRFLHFADKCIKDDFSGFVVLSIDCLLVETIQQFIDGVTNGDGKSTKLSTAFLERSRFQPYFANYPLRLAFYKDIRCGLLHQAEAKNKWLVRRKQPSMLRKVGADGYIIDVERFHAALKNSLEDYLAELLKPESKRLRANLWKKMNHICNERVARGIAYGSDASAASPTA